MQQQLLLQQPVVAENMTAAVALAALAALRLPMATVSKSPLLLEWRRQLVLCVPGFRSSTPDPAIGDEQQQLHVFPPDAPVPDWVIHALQVSPSTHLPTFSIVQRLTLTCFAGVQMARAHAGSTADFPRCLVS
jgi:hypothetical protein